MQLSVLFQEPLAAGYNKGITASFEQWGATGVAAYLLNPKVAYAATAPGTWRVKMEINFG
jgi:hypothetical protein